jgi:hypothetical protein
MMAVVMMHMVEDESHCDVKSTRKQWLVATGDYGLRTPGYSPTYASASISTRMSGSISAATCTIEVAGRISPKNSP